MHPTCCPGCSLLLSPPKIILPPMYFNQTLIAQRPFTCRRVLARAVAMEVWWCSVHSCFSCDPASQFAFCCSWCVVPGVVCTGAPCQEGGPDQNQRAGESVAPQSGLAPQYHGYQVHPDACYGGRGAGRGLTSQSKRNISVLQLAQLQRSLGPVITTDVLHACKQAS
jgi:hypothetical protein